jgi:hypothetical protein
MGVVWLLCFDTLSVRLCRFGLTSTRYIFWRLLGGEGGQLEGLMHGSRSPQAPESSGGVCLLASRPVRDPVERAVDRAALARERRGAPPASMAWGVPFCARALARAEGREGAMDRVQATVDREPEAQVSSRVPSRGGGCARARPDSFA